MSCKVSKKERWGAENYNKEQIFSKEEKDKERKKLPLLLQFNSNECVDQKRQKRRYDKEKDEIENELMYQSQEGGGRDGEGKGFWKMRE